MGEHLRALSSSGYLRSVHQHVTLDAVEITEHLLLCCGNHGVRHSIDFTF